MTPDKERLLQERCAAFKKITGQNRLYIVIQCALDIWLAGGMAFMLITTTFLYPLAIIGLILFKLALVFLLNGNKGNLAGLVVTAVYFPVFSHFEDLDAGSFAIIFLIIVAHLFRIVPCTAAKRISDLYGAPGFNGFILAQELSTDEGLMRTVLDRYDEASKDMLVGTAVKEMSLPKVIQSLKPLGVLLLTSGICLLMNANVNANAFKNARDVRIGEEASGKNVSAVTDKIYWRHTTGHFEGYWCRIDGQAVSVNVYDKDSKEKFMALCNACKASTEAQTAWLSGDSIGEGSSEPVSFVARVKPYSDYTFKFKPSNKTKEHIDEDVEIVEELFLDVIDPDKADRQFTGGMILTIVGVALTGMFYIIFFTSKYEVEML